MKHREEGTALLDPKHGDKVAALLEQGPDQPALTLVSANAVDYTTLRLIAECTVGLGNDRMAMFAATGTELVSLRAGEQVEPSAVLVPASNEGKYPTITQVTLAGTWTAADGTSVSGAVNVVDVDADALFWSDSAVQKFVVPYVASCTAHNAVAELTRLQDAWNYYPTGTMGMFALMHRTVGQGEALLLDNQLAFVRAAVTPDGSEFAALALSQYAGDRTLADPADPLTAPFSQAAPFTPYPGYHVLRAMAEAAASINKHTGYKDGVAYFRVTPGMTALPSTSDSAPDLTPGEVMIPVGTPLVPENRPVPESVLIQPSGGSEHPLEGLADAVFWSTGSIQQFLLPYYASTRGMNAPAELQTIVRCWETNIPHAPDTSTSAGATPMGGEESTEDVVVYALVHLPMSAWMTQEELDAAFYVTLDADDRQRVLDNLPFVDRLSALRSVGVLHRRRGRTHLLSLGDFTVLNPL